MCWYTATSVSMQTGRSLHPVNNRRTDIDRSLRTMSHLHEIATGCLIIWLEWQLPRHRFYGWFKKNLNRAGFGLKSWFTVTEFLLSLFHTTTQETGTKRRSTVRGIRPSASSVVGIQLLINQAYDIMVLIF